MVYIIPVIKIKNMIPHIIKDKSITLFIEGNSKTIDESHSNFTQIKSALINRDFSSIVNLLTPIVPKEVAINTKGKIKFRDEQFYYGDNVLNNTIVNRIIKLKKEGFPYEHMVKFLENLYENPSKNSVDQLYNFLEHEDLPITDDGCFLAYKAVRNDYLDKHSGKISNKVGSVVVMERNLISDDPSSHCAQGLHCGSMKYVSGFGNGSDKYLVIKVNPADVVSVPTDSNSTKVRVCKYEVLQEIDKTNVFTSSVVELNNKRTEDEEYLSDSDEVCDGSYDDDCDDDCDYGDDDDDETSDEVSEDVGGDGEFLSKEEKEDDNCEDDSYLDYDEGYAKGQSDSENGVKVNAFSDELSESYVDGYTDAVSDHEFGDNLNETEEEDDEDLEYELGYNDGEKSAKSGLKKVIQSYWKEHYSSGFEDGYDSVTFASVKEDYSDKNKILYSSDFKSFLENINVNMSMEFSCSLWDTNLSDLRNYVPYIHKYSRDIDKLIYEFGEDEDLVNVIEQIKNR